MKKPEFTSTKGGFNIEIKGDDAAGLETRITLLERDSAKHVYNVLWDQIAIVLMATYLICKAWWG